MPITRSLRTATSALLAVAAVLLIAPSAMAQSSGSGDRADKLDQVLRHRAGELSGRTRVIVQFNGDSDVRLLGNEPKPDDASAAAGQVAEVENVELSRIAADPRVERVISIGRSSRRWSGPASRPAPRSHASRSDVTGKGVGVAIIDSGITNWHDDLYVDGNPRASRTSRTSPTARACGRTTPSDDYGHGTHVAGIIAGCGYDSDGKHKGIAPGAKLVGLKVLDGYGHGYMSDVIAAIDYAISIKSHIQHSRHQPLGGLGRVRVRTGSTRSRWPRSAPSTLASSSSPLPATSGRTRRDRRSTGGITSPGNAPWVLTVGASSHQRHAASAANDTLRTSARVVRRGSTFRPSPTSSRLASESSRWRIHIARSTPRCPRCSCRARLSSRPRAQALLSLSGTSMAAPVVPALWR